MAAASYLVLTTPEELANFLVIAVASTATMFVQYFRASGLP